MNFRQRREGDEPDINLIPMIDVLLVVLIFLMVSTTYVKRTALKVDLPQGSAGQSQQTVTERIITIRISADGQYALNDKQDPLNEASLRVQLQSLAAAQGASAQDKPRVSIEADAATSHQAVVTAMDAAAAAGLSRVSIITSKR